MQNYFLVIIGAGFGGALRYWLSDVVYKILPATFPYGTLAVNIIGSFILGFIMFYFNSNELINPQLRLLLTTGLCGGLTTFSTFSFETISLFNESEIFLALTNIFLNVFLTLLFVFIAYILAKIISGV
jgi:fluoride exporter